MRDDASPILFEVGLGYSSLYIDPGDSMRDDWSQHFTVLDKWGVACKGKNFYAGVFAGGFIDAIIKTATNDEDADDARWLLGGTVGVKKLGSVPIGLSIHAAWAPPVDWDNTKKAFVAGASLNVPVDWVLED